jgi:hypothetical protein
MTYFVFVLMWPTSPQFAHLRGVAPPFPGPPGGRALLLDPWGWADSRCVILFSLSNRFARSWDPNLTASKRAFAGAGRDLPSLCAWPKLVIGGGTPLLNSGCSLAVSLLKCACLSDSFARSRALIRPHSTTWLGSGSA